MSIGRRLTAGAVILLAVLTVLGIHQSSLPLNSVSTSTPGNSMVLGSPLSVRSDEWLRWSPDVITEWTVPDAAERRSLLEVPVEESRLSPVLDWMLDTETRVAGLMPLDQAFAFWWWFPIFASAGAVFVLIGRFGGGRGLATAATVLFVASPVNAWWSFLPSRVAWAPMTAVLLLHSAGRRSGWRSFGMALLAGLSIARLPSSPYAPWSLVFALLSGGLLLDLWHREGVRWRDRRTLVVAPAAALGLISLWWLDVGGRYRVLASTEYPGSRRDTGGTDGLPSMWSGMFDGLHSTDRWSTNLIRSNLSEVAMGWTILLVPTVVLLFLASRNESGRPQRPPLAWSTGITVVFLLWSQIEWPSALSALNPLALVPGERVTQILGMWIAIPVVILLSSARANPGWLTPLIVGGSVGALGLLAANQHQSFFLDTSSTALVLVVAIAAALAAALTDRRWQIRTLSVVAGLSGLSIIWVNPVVVGVGDLQDSESAQVVQSLLGDDFGRVASDDYTVDPLLRVNGASMVSGQQYWGPDEDSWILLDPFETAKPEWNRGTSYVTFAWDSTVAEAQIIAVQPDLIQVRIDPCATMLTELNVSWIVSSRPLDGTCLTQVAEIQWRDLSRWILSRTPN